MGFSGTSVTRTVSFKSDRSPPASKMAAGRWISGAVSKSKAPDKRIGAEQQDRARSLHCRKKKALRELEILIRKTEEVKLTKLVTYSRIVRISMVKEEIIIQLFNLLHQRHVDHLLIADKCVLYFVVVLSEMLIFQPWIFENQVFPTFV